MTKDVYDLLEKYMISCMEDSAHDKDHIYRVLYNALRIAKTETGVNYDVLITACLLHDIGRKEQYENPELCHAMVGSEKAYSFLMEHGYERQHSAIAFYNSMYEEVKISYKEGADELEDLLHD